MSAEASRRERKGRLPKASGGRYGIDARAHGVDLSASAARRSSNSGAPVWNAAATSSRAYRRECAPLSRAFRIVGGSADPVAVPLARPPGPYIYTLPLLSRTYSFAADRVVGQQGGYGMAAQIAVMTLRPPVPAPAHNAAGRCGSGNSASSRRGTPSGSFGRVVLTARHLASRRPRQGLAVLTVDVPTILGSLRLRLPGLAGGGRRTGSSPPSVRGQRSGDGSARADDGQYRKQDGCGGEEDVRGHGEGGAAPAAR